MLKFTLADAPQLAGLTKVTCSYHHLESQGFKKTMMEKGLMLLDVPDGPLLFDGETQTALGHQKIVSSWMAATLQ